MNEAKRLPSPVTMTESIGARGTNPSVSLSHATTSVTVDVPLEIEQDEVLVAVEADPVDRDALRLAELLDEATINLDSDAVKDSDTPVDPKAKAPKPDTGKA